MTEQDLKLLSAVLNASLTGLPASGFTPEVHEPRDAQRRRGSRASCPSSSILRRMCSRRLIARKFTLPGRTVCWASRNIRTLTKAQEVLGALDEDTLSNLPARLDPDSPVQILVGPENVAQELKDTSVVDDAL